MLRQIRDYQRTTQSTVLLVSHSMEDVAGFTDKLLVMSKAKLYCYDDTPVVFRKADELKNMGLRIPQISSVMSVLRSRGVVLPQDIYTVSQAKDAMLALLRKEERPC